jgi:hypothetical protein
MHQPIVNALIAMFLALGTAVSDQTLHRAGQLLRELIADDVVDPETVDILESVLVAVDHIDAPAITFTSSEYGWIEAA